MQHTMILLPDQAVAQWQRTAWQHVALGFIPSATETNGTEKETPWTNVRQQETQHGSQRRKMNSKAHHHLAQHLIQ